MRWGRLLVANHRGVPVPRALGIALAVDAVVATFALAALGEVGRAGWGALAGALLVFGAGLVDDLVSSGPRGLREHLRSVAAGRMTTGFLKAVVAFGASAFVVALQPPRSGWTPVAGLILLAACTNVWNGLDVVPGRALKAFLAPALAFAVAGEVADAPAVLGLLVGAAVVLPFDLGERAMLGDAGSTLLGLGAGLALYDALPDPWVGAAAGLAVALNVVAESVSFSRVIDGARPLRWLDGLGRRA